METVSFFLYFYCIRQLSVGFPNFWNLANFVLTYEAFQPWDINSFAVDSVEIFYVEDVSCTKSALMCIQLPN